MTCTAVAVALASPAFADVVNLYEINNMEFYGTDGFGKGQDNYKYSCNGNRYEYSNIPSGMSCTEKQFPGGTICYVNCTCNDEFKYDENSCTNGLVPGGSSCTNPGTDKTLYTECNCGPEALSESDQAYLSKYFNGIETRSLDEKNCAFLSNPSCKQGYAQINSVPSDGSGSSSMMAGRYTATLTSTVQPLKYSFAASTSAPKTTPGTVFCLTDIVVQDNFRSAVSFYEDDLNATCATTAKATSLIGNKEYFYYTNTCKTDATPCDTSGVPQTALSTSSFSYYDKTSNAVNPTTCSYASSDVWCSNNGFYKTCPTGQIATTETCEYDATYKKCTTDKDLECENKGFKKCTSNEIGSGGTCEGRTGTYYKTCTLKTTWCTNNGYYSPCPSGQVATNESCQYATIYKKCITKEQWCINNGYKNSCPSEQQLSGEACTYNSSYKKDCVAISADQKCKNDGYTTKCSSGYFNNDTDYCTGNSAIWYKTSCTKISCSSFGSNAYPSQNPSADCKNHCGDGNRYTFAGSYLEQSYANDGKTKCWKNLNIQGTKTYNPCNFCVDADSGNVESGQQQAGAVGGAL